MNKWYSRVIRASDIAEYLQDYDIITSSLIISVLPSGAVAVTFKGKLNKW